MADCSEYFVGVDVGTGSARAALVSKSGTLVRTAVAPIAVWNPTADFFQQSSENIWSACCKVIKEVSSSVAKDSVKGLAFDATCSLVVLDETGEPMSVSPDGEPEQNVMLWLDHRAVSEADGINKVDHPLLGYVGGKVSLEMELPKLLWLKNNMEEERWLKVGHFFDLTDFLSWKATGADSRSLCTVTCKWAYDAIGQKWDEKFLSAIGLDDILVDDCRKIGREIKPPGSACGNGLSESAAAKLNLLPGTPVATSVIDAHAGVLGLVGAKTPDRDTSISLDSRLALICGTSACHMALSKDPLFVPGVWGPYFNVLGMQMWLNEGGQSATGKLLDHVIDSHPATPTIKEKLPESVYIGEYLTSLLKAMAEKKNLKSVDFLTSGLHIWPDFHGNRSPVADHTLKGMICGLSLSASEEELALIYLAVMQSLAYSTKHILSTIVRSGHSGGIDTLLVCGGLSRNGLFVQAHADALDCRILVPEEQNAMLMGSAMLAATAAKAYASVQEAVLAMSCRSAVVEPNSATAEYHKKKYGVFLRMLEDQRTYRTMMDQ